MDSTLLTSPLGPRLDQAAMLAANDPQDVGFERGKSGCRVIALILIILAVTGFLTVSNWLGGGQTPSPSASPTPTYQGSLPPPPS